MCFYSKISSTWRQMEILRSRCSISNLRLAEFISELLNYSKLNINMYSWRIDLIINRLPYRSDHLHSYCCWLNILLSLHYEKLVKQSSTSLIETITSPSWLVFCYQFGINQGNSQDTESLYREVSWTMRGAKLVKWSYGWNKWMKRQ